MAALLRRSPILTLDQLRDLVAQGDVDTVLTVFPDFYGRLVGKRIVGRYFCDEVLAEGMHVCNYLLACDMEMDPVPGYRFASWEQGYGDVRCLPDESTLRRATWLERPAIVLCDVVEEERDALVSVAPRHVLYKQAAKEIADQQNLALTFMAKLDERWAGSSMHVHSSLWSPDGATPLFAGETPIPGTRARASDKFRWWLGGLMAHARASTDRKSTRLNSSHRCISY